MHIVTISGLSGSGKTLLAKKISDYFEDSQVISLDNYSFDKEYLYSKYGYINFSQPTAFNYTVPQEKNQKSLNLGLVFPLLFFSV